MKLYFLWLFLVERVFEWKNYIPNLVPPQNIEAEEAVFRGLFFLLVTRLFRLWNFLTPEDFYRVSHQLILRQ